MNIKSLVSITVVNESFADLTFVASVSRGWFKLPVEQTVTKRIVKYNDREDSGWWEFAETGQSISTMAFGYTLSKAFKDLKPGEKFHFTSLNP